MDRFLVHPSDTDPGRNALDLETSPLGDMPRVQTAHGQLKRLGTGEPPQLGCDLPTRVPGNRSVGCDKDAFYFLFVAAIDRDGEQVG